MSNVALLYDICRRCVGSSLILPTALRKSTATTASASSSPALSPLSASPICTIRLTTTGTETRGWLSPTSATASSPTSPTIPAATTTAATSASSSIPSALHRPLLLRLLLVRQDWSGEPGERMLCDERYRLAYEALDVANVLRLIARQITERDGHTTPTRSARASDTMHVRLRLIWRMIIHYVRDVVDVEAACCDVSGDEDADGAVTEGLHRRHTRVLALVAVYGHSTHTVLLQPRNNLDGESHQNDTRGKTTTVRLRFS